MLGLVFKWNQGLQLDPVKAASVFFLWLSTQLYIIQFLGAADSWKAGLNCGRIWKKKYVCREIQEAE